MWLINPNSINTSGKTMPRMRVNGKPLASFPRECTALHTWAVKEKKALWSTKSTKYIKALLLWFCPCCVQKQALSHPEHRVPLRWGATGCSLAWCPGMSSAALWTRWQWTAHPVSTTQFPRETLAVCLLPWPNSFPTICLVSTAFNQGFGTTDCLS